MPSQMVGAGTGALSGAGAGMAVGGPWGAAIGGVAGAALGYFGSDDKGYSLPWDQYNSRLSQIADYSNKLSGATDAYSNALTNMYQTTWNQYLPNAAAAFAGRGLNIDSGAFGAELARTSSAMTAQGLADVAKTRIGNIDKVQSQYGSAWDSMFGASVGSNKAGFDQSNENTAGLLGLATNVGGQAMRYKMLAKSGNPNFYGGTNPGGPSENYGLGPSWNGGNPFAE